MPTEEKLDQLIAGVDKINKEHEKFEKDLGTSKADAKINLENIKTSVAQIVTDMQEEKQALAAEAAAQKESFELLQKEIISLGNGSGGGKMEDSFKEYDNHLARYFKRNVAVPENEVEVILNDIMTKAIHGCGDSEIKHQVKDLVAGSNVDGGFFITSQRASTMSTRIFETSPIRPLADVQTTTSDVWETILDDGEPDAGWVGEVSDRPKTNTSQIGVVQIPIHEMYAMPRLSQKMIDDAGFDVVGWHQRKVTGRFSRLENTSYTKGDGAGKPKGWLSYPTWTTPGTYERGAVEQITSAASGVIDADDLLNLQGTLIPEYGLRSQWAMNRTTLFNNVFTLKDTQGQYLINPKIISEGGQLTLLGRPVNLFEDMVNVTANSLSIGLADWMEFYTIVDRLGIRVIRDAVTEKPYVLLYTIKRTGGGVTNYQAGKILKTKA